MQKDRTNILMTIFVVLLILSILACIICGVLYFTTDIFKSKKEMFIKYFAQNIENIADVTDVSEELKNISFLQQNDYLKATNLTLKYLEEQDDQEENYNLKEEAVVINSRNEAYRNIEAKYNDETLLNVELLNQEEMYGFRLSNIVQQFVSVENKNVTYFMKSLGYNGENFEEQLQNVDISNLFNFSNEEIETLTNTYANIIFSDINKKSFTIKSNEVRTLNNGQSVTTDAYTLTLTKNDIDKIFKRVLNQAIQDEIILSKIQEIDNKIRRIWNKKSIIDRII